jgi:hypothetical protein
MCHLYRYRFFCIFVALHELFMLCEWWDSQWGLQCNVCVCCISWLQRSSSCMIWTYRVWVLVSSDCMSLCCGRQGAARPISLYLKNTVGVQKTSLAIISMVWLRSQFVCDESVFRVISSYMNFSDYTYCSKVYGCCWWVVMLGSSTQMCS